MFDASAIEQVLLLAKNARGPSAIIDLISGALTRPDLFVFGELLDLPLINELKEDSRVAPWYAALDLFAYGTWKDYTDHPETFPEFSQEQKLKLKQLTAVTAVQGRKVTSYSDLRFALEMEGVRDLEDFLIDHCFYAEIINGKIDQEKGLVVVSDSIKRDVRFEDFAEIKSKLKSWVSTSEKCLENVLSRIIFTKEIAETTEAKKKSLVIEAEKRIHELTETERMSDGQFAITRPIPETRGRGREAKTRRSNQYP